MSNSLSHGDADGQVGEEKERWSKIVALYLARVRVG